MCAILEIVADVFVHQPFQMALIENDHVVEQIPAAGSYPVWGHRIDEQNAEGTEGDNEALGSAAVGRVCSGALFEPVTQCGPGLRDQNSGDVRPPKANKAIPIGRVPYLHDPDPVPGKSIDGGNICRANE
jgi:hypothetical protein